MGNISIESKKNIFQNMSVINARKYFGEYDEYIEKSSFVYRFSIAKGNPLLSIAIAVMERYEKFLVTFTRLLRSIEFAQIASEIIIVDNSLDRSLLELLQSMLADFDSNVLIAVIYHHDPRLTFSTARNAALQNIAKESKIVAYWDSDIYCQDRTISAIMHAWEAAPSLSGIAPPLGSYLGGDLATAFQDFSLLKEQDSLQRLLIMPGSFERRIGTRWYGNVRETTVLRGAFFLKRSLIEAVAKHMTENEPWHRDIVVHCTIPFMISARELKERCGYIMLGEAMVFHDERTDDVAMSAAYPMRTLEILKTYMLIFYRNELDSVEQQQNNEPFLTWTRLVIYSTLHCSMAVTKVVLQMLIALTACIRQASCPAELEKASIEALLSYTENLQEMGRKVCQLLMHEQVFRRVKQWKSIDIASPIYSLVAP